MKTVKRILSVTIAVIMCFAVAVPMVGAQTPADGGITTMSLQVDMFSSLEILPVSGTTEYKAYAESDAIGTSDVTQITAEQYIQKHWAFGIFFTATGSSHYTKYSYTNTISFSSLTYNLGAGTYRVKTIFTFETASGKTEQYTIYSDEVTVG